jgi:RNA polymerase sigma-70 factor (ECF subfamily)
MTRNGTAGKAKTDGELVHLALSGSSEAFGALVSRYRPPVVRLAYRFVRDHEEANDIAQSAFLRAYRSLGSFRSERPFSHWLFTIARNASLDAVRCRRAYAEIEPTLSSIEPGPEDLAVRGDEAARIRAAVGALPERYRRVIEMHYLKGFRYREIAAKLGIPLGTVKTAISRAKQRLRSEMSAGEVPEAA